MTENSDTNFIAPLRMHFQISKVTLDSLIRGFNVFRVKLSLGAPGNKIAAGLIRKTKAFNVQVHFIFLSVSSHV